MEFRQGRKLYKYQEDSVEAILRLENDMPIANKTFIPLTEPCGSGKTFILLGVILKRPIPTMCYCNLTGTNPVDADEPVRAIPRGPNQIIRPTAIVVARSVYSQWLANIKQYTTLRVFEAKDLPSVRKLLILVRNGMISDYDVVLFKSGKTLLYQHETTYPSEPIDESIKYVGPVTSVDLCKFFTKNAGPYFWSRLICDDVDVIAYTNMLRAMSVIFATGAVHTSINIYSPDTQGAYNVAELMNGQAEIGRACFTRGSLWETLGHTVEQIGATQKLFAINWHRYLIRNKEMERAARIIGDTAFDYSAIVDMIRNDAVVTAAKTLGISVASPSALLANVLGNQRTDYEVARARKVVLLAMLEYITANDEDPMDEESTDEVLKTIDAAIIRLANKSISAAARGAMSAEFHISHTAPAIKDQIASIDHFARAIQRSFERISENMKDQLCAICYAPLSGENIMIAKCCGFVTCSGCCIDGARFRETAKGLEGLCMQCRTPIDLKKDIVMVQNDVDVGALMSDILSAVADAKVPLPIASTSASAASAQSAARVKITSKTEFITRLIQNALDGCTGFTQLVDKPLEDFDILVGKERADPPGGKRKFFVCSTFDESLETISAALLAADIRHEVLSGTIGEITNILDRFKRDVDVLLVNITSVYAGIDLQCITDVVLFSKHDKPRIGQVIGRAARLGRTCTLNVHTVEYDNSS